VCASFTQLRTPLFIQKSRILVIRGGRLANWRRRTRIIDYCVDVLDASYEENKRIADGAGGADIRARRKAQAELYSSDIKVNGGFVFPSNSVRSHCPLFDF